MTAKCLPVPGEPAKAVAHRVGIFTEDQRASFIRHADPFFDRPFWHRRERLVLINTSIHRTDNVGCRRICPTAFVLYRARWIGGFQPAVKRIMVCTVPGFIPQRPDDNGRMVTIALHHAGHTFTHGRQPAGIVSKTAHWHHAVGFDIGLVHNVQTVAVAKPVPQRVIRIMRATDGVKVVLLHQLDIAAHRRFIHHLPVFRMMLMAVHAPNQQRFTVEFQQAIADFNPAKTDVACLDVQHITLCVPKRNCQAVKFWRFRAPQYGLFDGDRHR